MSGVLGVQGRHGCMHGQAARGHHARPAVQRSCWLPSLCLYSRQFLPISADCTGSRMTRYGNIREALERNKLLFYGIFPADPPTLGPGGVLTDSLPMT